MTEAEQHRVYLKHITQKDVDSLADFGSDYWQEGEAIEPAVSRQLLQDVANGSQTVDAILRHMTLDIANGGWRIVPAPGVKNPSESQREKLVNFFARPNPDDVSEEWLENFVYDLLLQSDAFWEKSGSQDDYVEEGNKSYFGGDLVGIWHLSAAEMFIIANDKTGQLSTNPLAMSYRQKVGSSVVNFHADKIVRVSRFRRGRAYGQSPLLSLLNIIAGQINLIGYIGELYAGNIPKTLVNAGDLDPEELDILISSIQKQLKNASNPFGLLAINVPNGFQLQRLMDTHESGQFLEQLRFYREEICALFGMPPSKMGWATAGKLGSSEEMQDTYYDNIERLQYKVSRGIYNGVILALECPDWVLKFNDIRPKKIKLVSEARAKNARFIQVMRQEGCASPNEMRAIGELDQIDEEWANDPRWPSPVIASRGGGESGGEEEPEEEGESAKKVIIDPHFPYVKKKRKIS